MERSPQVENREVCRQLGTSPPPRSRAVAAAADSRPDDVRLLATSQEVDRREYGGAAVRFRCDGATATLPNSGPEVTSLFQARPRGTGQR